MARISNEEEYAQRRNEILDVAQRLVYTKGYEQMTIQDILGDLQISKGAFYHYFDSKQDLLEALIERMLAEGIKVIRPIIDDPDLPALEKFRRYFDTAARWKTAQKDFLLALLRVWYTDDNAIVRQKFFAATLETVSPMFIHIIYQGIREGVFNPTYPERVSEVVLSLILSMADTISRQVLSCGQDQECADAKQMMGTILSFSDALERVLGAPAGSLDLMDEATMQAWVTPTSGNPPGPPPV